MTEDDIFEQFKKTKQYSDLSKIFGNIVYDKKGTVNPNTAYIYCDVILPEFDVGKQKKVFDCETTSRLKNSNIFQGTLMFFSKNQYLGSFNDINNILYLVDFPISENHDILNEIIKQIQEIKEEKIQSTKHYISTKPRSKIMLEDKIYDLKANNVEMSFLDRLLNRTPERCLRKDGRVYSLNISNEQDIGLDAYKRTIAEKAQDIIASYRQKYYDDTMNFRHMHQDMINSNVHMPQFDPVAVAKSGLMMTSQNGKIIYMFHVDINVHSVINENGAKYVKLAKPINFNDGLLIIITTPIGNIIGVKFKHRHRHYHTDADDDVCLGSASTKISQMNINSLNDILKLKNTIVNMMSVCNVASMFSSAYKAEEMKHLVENARPGSLEKMVIGDIYE